MPISERSPSRTSSPQQKLGSLRECFPGRRDPSFHWGDGWAPGVALLLAGCNRPADQPARTSTRAAATAQYPDTRIACATAGAAALTRACTVDRETSPRGLVLTLRNPDGGFHRLLVTTDGRGVIAADGAQGAKVSVVGPDEIEVAVTGDRYRLPATVGKRTR